MSNRSLRILFTGDYATDYNRTRILKRGLHLGGHEVIEFPFTKKNSETKKKLKELATDYDFVFLPCFTHKQVEYVKKILPDKKLIFDPLISRHMTRIYDYKLALPFGLSAIRNYFRDKRSMRAADFVVTDTEAHRQYFHKKFNIPLEKMGVLYIGNDFDLYSPKGRTPSDSKYLVGFYGGFIPLQGVMNILGAAEILKKHDDIRFELIGSGFEFDKALQHVKNHKLDNVHLPGWIQRENELADRICEFDVCLGIFGDTMKSNLVIPNKVYHYGACARPIITKDTPAIREIFTPGQDIYLCGTSAREIADAILFIKDNPSQAEQMGQVAYHNLLANYSAEMIGEKLAGYFGTL